MTLVELLASIVLFAIVVTAISSVVWMGQQSARETTVYAEAERKLADFVAVATGEGMDSSGVSLAGSDYRFEKNAKSTVIRYLPGEQAVVLLQGGVETMRLTGVTSFALATDALPYRLSLTITDSDGAPHERESRWTPRISKGG